MPVEFVNHNLVENISLLIQNLLFTSNISCIFSTKYFNANLSNEKNIVIYRIISELLNNTIKHANARNIRISFDNDEKIMNITYSDDGTGFEITNKSTLAKGLGMRNIQSRLKTINAKYHFKSAPGEGMSLHFSFTYNPDFEIQNN
jgi:signal transduction histidine kinase